MGGRPPQDWCGRAVLYSATQASSASCRSVLALKTRSMRVKNSARIVLCSRSTFPVVVGEYGAVSRCRMSLSAQIRSNITGPGPRPKRPVNTLPLSVKIWEGSPWRRSASVSAWQTGRAVARSTTFAQTMNREWSSIPVTILTSVPSARCTRPITSICHNSIARLRSHRR
jgi:hypothetical protein